MFRMQTASDVRKLMVHQIRCKGPTLLKWVQTWSLASLNFERILDPENTGTTSFSTLSVKSGHWERLLCARSGRWLDDRRHEGNGDARGCFNLAPCGATIAREAPLLRHPKVLDPIRRADLLALQSPSEPGPVGLLPGSLSSRAFVQVVSVPVGILWTGRAVMQP